jgi:N,N-dimethylformamidase
VQLHIDDVTLAWDLAQDIRGKTVVDVSGNGRDGVLYQLPSRAVTGPDWDGTTQSWRDCPAHYDAVHFHSDDLYDADWPVTCELALPRDLPSGIYAFRLRDELSVDRIVFFVRPALGAPCAEVALLMPSCTYMAYANHRMLLDGADFVAARNALRPEHEYLRRHREVGLSCYEKHADGSGVMFSSRRRPVMQMRPGADRWNFTPDTCLNAFLEHLDIGHDIIADEDVHADGLAALSPYRLIVTGTHPEYWSTRMLDALEQWQQEGGRLMYLGGNGFYWRVAFSDAWPGAIELRRAEDGVRNWQSEPGESYHAFNGEYGGLWRRLGRAPNQLVGIGFAAQGFERAIGYQRNAASHDSRAAWIFDGVPEGAIGASGLGGGAAGQEIDRYDPSLGSPSHALVVASATDFGADMLRTKEEFEAAMVPTTDDEMVRADIVFYETPAGGAVFSVGSISWFGALARDDYANDIARITENVVRRFADARPFGDHAAATGGAESTDEKP